MPRRQRGRDQHPTVAVVAVGRGCFAEPPERAPPPKQYRAMSCRHAKRALYAVIVRDESLRKRVVRVEDGEVACVVASSGRRRGPQNHPTAVKCVEFQIFNAKFAIIDFEATAPS